MLLNCLHEYIPSQQGYIYVMQQLTMLVGSQSIVRTTTCLMYTTIYSNAKNKYCSIYKNET